MKPWWSRPTAESTAEQGDAASQEPASIGSERPDKLAPEEVESAKEEEPKAEKKPARKKRAPRKTTRTAKTTKTPAKPAAKRRTTKKEEAPKETSPRPKSPEGDSGEGAFNITFGQIQELIREVGDSPATVADTTERKMALFCDFENIVLGIRDSDSLGDKFEIGWVLERLVDKGKIIVKKAYSDWYRYTDYKRIFHEASFELIDIPQKRYSGKNSADIKMVVDAMDMSYSKEHLDTYVIVSGDSDFSPLVSKLKENNKYVIGVGVKNSSSHLLVDNCDEFIYYEDIARDREYGVPNLDTKNDKDAEVFGLMIDSIQALMRENKDVLWGSMIKQTMQRKKPSFSEGYYGYSSFSELLQDAQDKNLVRLRRDRRSGGYIVTGFG